jgi:cytochrome c oxidase subunit 2
MLLRVYVDTPEQFQQWIANQQRTQAELSQAQSGGTAPPSQSQEDTYAITPQNGQRVFEQQACINCHAVAGTVANGQYGPDLTHLMSRATLAAGATENTPENLKAWITDPNRIKSGSLMPAMHLSDRQNAQITAYLLTLK